MTAKQYSITDGPSKFDLMTALFVKGQRVMFTIICNDGMNSNEIFKAQILSVQVEDGSYESWNLTGAMHHVNYPEASVNFKAYFETRRRRGTLSLTQKPLPHIEFMLNGRVAG